MTEPGGPGGSRPDDSHSSPGGGDPRMIDLPLRHEPGAKSAGPPEQPPRPQPTSDRRPERRHSVLVWLIPLVVVGTVLWWLFWPAPARIETSEPALEFETARVGDDGGARGFTLLNAGERNLRIVEVVAVGEAAADFEVDAGECLTTAIAPGEVCQVEVRYIPTAAGDRRAALEIHGKASNSPFALPVSAGAVAPRVGLAPESIDFGAVQVGQQRARLQLTISNIGSAPLELGRVRFEGPQSDEFDRDQRCPDTSLAPGEACSFDVRFAPTAAGTRVAELLIASDAPDQPTRLPLRGRGVWEGPPLEAEPQYLDLGEQRVARRSDSGRLRFVNRTSGAVEIAGLSLTPEDVGFVVSSDGCGSRTLISGEDCEVTVTVEPESEGALKATLDLEFTAAGTLRVPLTATGVEPRLEVRGETLAFGELRAGFESGAKGAKLVNTGSATLTVREAVLTGRDSSEFVLKSGCVGTVLKVGEECSVRVAFRPRSAGGRRAELEITASEDLDPLSVALNGTGTVAGLAVEPTSVTWVSMQLGKAEDRQVRIANTGSARLQVNGLRVAGDGASDFAVRGIECRLDAGLGPGEECGFSIRFAPSVEGARTAEIEISHNGPDSPFRVVLTGTGEPARPLFRASVRDFGFGSVSVGQKSDIATLTISNPGSAWLSLGGTQLRGRHGDEFELVPGTCDGTAALAPGGSCTVGVRFVPAVTGRRQGTLEINHTAAGSPALISLAGVGG